MTADQITALFDLGLACGLALMFGLGYIAAVMP